MTRREQIDDKQAELELQTWTIAGYERWKQCWNNDGQAGDYGQAFPGEREVPITDPSDLDEWFNTLANAHGMTGAEAEQQIRSGGTFGPSSEGPVRV